MTIVRTPYICVFPFADIRTFAIVPSVCSLRWRFTFRWFFPLSLFPLSCNWPLGPSWSNLHRYPSAGCTYQCYISDLNESDNTSICQSGMTLELRKGVRLLLSDFFCWNSLGRYSPEMHLEECTCVTILAFPRQVDTYTSGTISCSDR